MSTYLGLLFSLPFVIYKKNIKWKIYRQFNCLNINLQLQSRLLTIMKNLNSSTSTVDVKESEINLQEKN